MLYVDRRAEKVDHFCRACRPGAMAINRGHVGAVLEGPWLLRYRGKGSSR